MVRTTVLFLFALFSLSFATSIPKPLNLKDDPEEEMTAVQMIRYWGYPAEEITVTTTDGYVLGMQRIPYGKAGPGPSGTCRPVIFLQHGLECDSTNWIINMPDQSAAFIFADAGYDVWLGNMRGNTYSKNHATLDPSHQKFWEFTWDEMAQIDLQAMIDKVLQETGQPSLYYVGHSQGTLTMFSKLSSDPTMAPKLKKFFALAPVGSVKHIKGLIKFLEEYFLGVLELFYEIFGTGEFLPNNWIMDLLAKWLCGNSIGDALCDDILFLIAGPESNQYNKTRTPVYIAHTPAGTSTMNVMHWAQMVKEGTVSRYDYGSASENQKHYGQSKPPSYDFEKISGVEIFLYWSDDDWLADPTDIKEYLLTSLKPELIKQNNHMTGYNHLDYIWGLNAAKEIYYPIVDYLKNDQGGSVHC